MDLHRRSSNRTQPDHSQIKHDTQDAPAWTRSSEARPQHICTLKPTHPTKGMKHETHSPLPQGEQSAHSGVNVGVNVNVNNKEAISESDFDNSGEPGPQAVSVGEALCACFYSRAAEP